MYSFYQIIIIRTCRIAQFEMNKKSSFENLKDKGMSYTASSESDFGRKQSYRSSKRTQKSERFRVDEQQFQNYPIEEVVRKQIFKALLMIKGEIESKIKEIDIEIKAIRSNFQIINQGHLTQIQSVFKRIETLEAKIEEVKNTQQDHIKKSECLIIQRNSRSSQLLKERKPIFVKSESFLNLSSILFPEDNDRNVQTIKTQQKAQQIKIQQIRKDPQPNVEQTATENINVNIQVQEELNKNKNRFLKKRNKTQNYEITTEKYAAEIIKTKYDAHQIKEEQNEESILYDQFR